MNARISLYKAGGDIVVTRIKNGIHVQVTVSQGSGSSETSSWVYIDIPIYSFIKNEVLYTCSATIKNASNNISEFVAYDTGSTVQRYELSGQTNNGESVLVFENMSGDMYYRIRATGVWAANDVVSFDLINLGLYEGGYKNPQFMTSLDSYKGNQFAIITSGTSVLYNPSYVRNILGTGWSRIVRLTNSTTSGNSVDIKFMIQGTWNGIHPVTIEGHIRYYCDSSINTNKIYADIVQSYYQKEASPSALTNCITKYRFATDGTDIYLEAYNKYSSASPCYMTIKDYMIGDLHKGIPSNLYCAYEGNSGSGNSDTLIGAEIGYRLLGSYTMVNP